MLERTYRTIHMMEKDKKTPNDRITILNKELAMVAYELLQSRIFPKESEERQANAMLELADAMLQIHMLCLDMDFLPEDILKLGVQHAFERFQDFDARGWGEKEPEADVSKKIIVEFPKDAQGITYRIMLPRDMLPNGISEQAWAAMQGFPNGRLVK